MQTSKLMTVLVFLTAFAANAAEPCKDMDLKIDREIAQLKEVSAEYDKLTSEYDAILSQATDGKPENVLEEVKTFNGIKAKFAKGKLETTIRAKRTSVANMRKSFCTDCAKSAVETETAKTAYCTRCPEGSPCATTN